MAVPSPAPPSVVSLDADDPRWLRFLQSQPDATLFHHPAWSRVLAETYGYRPLVLIQTDAAGAVEAGVPLLEVKPRHFIGLPFTDHSPPLASTPASLAGFTANLLEWRQLTGARALSVHGAVPATPGIQPVTRAVRHLLPLGCPTTQMLERLKGSQVLRAIRKAERAGLQVSLGRSPARLEVFYALHLQTRRRLGVPVQPKRFLDILWKRVLEPGLGFVVLAFAGKQPIAGALFLSWNRNLVYKFGASDPRYWEVRPNNLVMWTAIDWACQHGYRLLDLGRTDLGNQGLRDFKSRWGAVEVPLVYSYLAARPPRSMPSAASKALTGLIQSSPPIVCRLIGELLYGRVAGWAA